MSCIFNNWVSLFVIVNNDVFCNGKSNGGDWEDISGGGEGDNIGGCGCCCRGFNVDIVSFILIRVV